VTEGAGARRRRVSLELSLESLEKIDHLKGEWGLRNRGDILERLLQEIFWAEDADALDLARPADDPAVSEDPLEPAAAEPRGALVVLRRDGSGELVWGFEPGGDDDDDDVMLPRRPRSAAEGRGTGIDLPGFVRRQSTQLQSSLQAGSRPSGSDDPLPQLSAELLERALEQASSHWLEIYGSAPGEAVLEAAMVWLAQDIWPHSDLSEGRPFTWTLASATMQRLAPSWSPGPASFARVMVLAGVLEDPFSAHTLEVRQPTLIRRFVQRFRRRKRGMSFETLAHTMTLHGALRLLNLPTAPGQRLTLEQIREAYRELALANHPDAGGCDQTMRRLNEAYQLLKELYRKH